MKGKKGEDRKCISPTQNKKWWRKIHCLGIRNMRGFSIKNENSLSFSFAFAFALSLSNAVVTVSKAPRPFFIFSGPAGLLYSACVCVCVCVCVCAWFVGCMMGTKSPRLFAD